MDTPKPLLSISDRARELHQRSIVVDTHVDTTQRLFFDGFGLGQRHSDGSVDIPRLRDGGVDAIFFAVWMPGTITGQKAVDSAFRQLDAVHLEIGRHPHELVFARTAADIHRARANHRIAVLLAVEGGHMMNRDLNVLREFSARGVTYMTLTHARTTDWADASTDAPLHNGLSDFGREVIHEMNRLGIMVDISHVSDTCFSDVLETSAAPIFASHSSCRALCPSPRNLTDDMIHALAQKGGVVQINFHVGFLSREFRAAESAKPHLEKRTDEEAQRICGENMACQILESDRIVRRLVGEGELPRVDWTEIVRHIDHATRIAGVDHVGLGSDFDGANMPFGMEDASRMPLITEALLQKGYSEIDIGKILGGNMLRFMQGVEAARESLTRKGRTE